MGIKYTAHTFTCIGVAFYLHRRTSVKCVFSSTSLFFSCSNTPHLQASTFPISPQFSQTAVSPAAVYLQRAKCCCVLQEPALWRVRILLWQSRGCSQPCHERQRQAGPSSAGTAPAVPRSPLPAGCATGSGTEPRGTPIVKGFCKPQPNLHFNH